jgi:GT2 family glycosyltransferase
MKDVSIVILNYNGKNKLKIILNSITKIKIALKHEIKITMHLIRLLILPTANICFY